MRLPDHDLITRTRRRLLRTSDAALKRLRPSPSPDLSDRDRDRLEEEIRLTIAPTAGEMAARRRATKVADYYMELDGSGRQRFFELLATSFGLDRGVVDAAIAEHADARAVGDADAVLGADRKLRSALAPPRELLFTRCNGMEHGVKFVVDLRADLREFRSSDPEFRAMDLELKHVLAAWFDAGNLELRRITWDSPASLLERLSAYESVHAITSWGDLKNRLDSDRRCYAFFHPGMPEEPLIFVEIALVQGLAGDLTELLNLDAPELDADKADTAIFYSISNCQDGLAGVNLGDLLIKRVVTALVRDLPNLRTFSTLSPITNFRGWLTETIAAEGDAILRPDEIESLRWVFSGPNVAQQIDAVLDTANWHLTGKYEEALKEPLLRLGARYVLEEKRNDRALCRVANFHLSNGARVERLNWLANSLPVGFERSAGMMANYRYVPDQIANYHDKYVTTGEITAEPSVRKLLADPTE